MTEEAKEKKRQYLKQWRADHREEINAYSRKWRAEHPERIAAINSRYWNKKASEAKEPMQNDT